MSDAYNGGAFDAVFLRNYLSSLVNRFFKILPMREANESTLSTYMESLMNELIGCKQLPTGLGGDAMYLSLLATLQYLIDHQDSSERVFRREVFKSISICNHLRSKIGGAEK